METCKKVVEDTYFQKDLLEIKYLSDIKTCYDSSLFSFNTVYFFQFSKKQYHHGIMIYWNRLPHTFLLLLWALDLLDVYEPVLNEY